MKRAISTTIILIIFLILWMLTGSVFAHGEGCIDPEGYRVTHFDTSKPKWGIQDAKYKHGHEMMHPTNKSLNLLHWYIDEPEDKYAECGAYTDQASDADEKTDMGESLEAYIDDRSHHEIVLERCLNDEYTVEDDCNPRNPQRSPVCCEIVTAYFEWLREAREVACAPPAPRKPVTLALSWGAIKRRGR